MNKNISVSILNVENVPDFLNNLKYVKSKIQNSDKDFFDMMIHFDIMDNKFVNNKGVNLKWIKTAKNLGFYTDVHLMVENPIKDINTAILYSCDAITIHYEIKGFEKVLDFLNEEKIRIKKEYNREFVIGVSVKPETKIEELKKYETKFSKLLIMTVEPGYGGQKYISDMNKKIKEASILFKNKILQVDGGINKDTINESIKLGVNSFVVGSFLSKEIEKENIYKKIMLLNAIKCIEELPRTSNIELDKTILQIKEGGYGKGDLLLGISVPVLRKIVKQLNSYMDFYILDFFANSKYHEYRRFYVFSLSMFIEKIYKELNKKNSKVDLEKLELDIVKIIENMDKNIKGINNWDLTDEIGSNVLGKYLLTLSKDKMVEKLNKYIDSNDVWIKRIGIVSLLAFSKEENIDTILSICDKVIYEDYHLYQKATGWVLRECYKKEPNKILNYLNKKNETKKLPSILVSYACEKMNKQEKEYVRKNICLE